MMLSDIFAVLRSVAQGVDPRATLIERYNERDDEMRLSWPAHWHRFYDGDLPLYSFGDEPELEFPDV